MDSGWGAGRGRLRSGKTETAEHYDNRREGAMDTARGSQRTRPLESAQCKGEKPTDTPTGGAEGEREKPTEPPTRGAAERKGKKLLSSTANSGGGGRKLTEAAMLKSLHSVYNGPISDNSLPT